MKKETLSEKIREIDSEASGWADDIKNKKVIPTKDVKEKIQHTERRLKEEIKNSDDNKRMGFYGYVIKIIDKIFKEEFGEKLRK